MKVVHITGVPCNVEWEFHFLVWLLTLVLLGHISGMQYDRIGHQIPYPSLPISPLQCTRRVLIFSFGSRKEKKREGKPPGNSCAFLGCGIICSSPGSPRAFRNPRGNWKTLLNSNRDQESQG